MHVKKDAKIGKNTCTRSSFKCWNPRSFRGVKPLDPPTRLCPDPPGWPPAPQPSFVILDSSVVQKQNENPECLFWWIIQNSLNVDYKKTYFILWKNLTKLNLTDLSFMWTLLKLMFNKGLGQKSPDTKPSNNELYKLFIYLLIVSLHTFWTYCTSSYLWVKLIFE
jgi:hypothetical protein